jgi:signal transduction histidine kinase/ligand-binding sensor domain-containing protein/DNA-binding response OmpR family regulator
MRHRIRTTFITVLTMIFFPAMPCKAQEAIDLVRAPSQNHISENASRAMIKDDLGYIWIGTIDGLNRYDGYQFRIYQNDPLDSTSISGNYITRLLQDSSGAIWVGTHGGLNRYSRTCDCFTRYYPDRADPHAVSGLGITDLLEDTGNHLWASTYHGLSRWDPAGQHFINIPIDTNGSDTALRDRQVLALENDPQGGIWIAYDAQFLSRLRNGRLEHFRLMEPLSPAEPVIGIKDLHVLADGRLLVGTRKGIYLFDPVSGEFRFLLAGRVWEIVELSPGRIAVSFSFDGMYEWDAARETFAKIPIKYEEDRVDGDIRLYFQDERGIIWGTYRGLAKQDPFEKRFRHIPYEKSNKDGLSEASIVGIGGDSDGNLWVGAQNTGLNYYNAQTGVWHNYRNDPAFDNELKYETLGFNTYFDGAYVWMANADRIFRFDSETRRLRRFFNPSRENLTSTGNFLRDKRGRIWLGAGSGLMLYDPNAQQWFLQDYPIKILHEDRHGRLWGLSSQHIYRYDDRAERFLLEAVLSELLPGSISGSGVDCMNSDGRGNLWIGTNVGLLKYNQMDRSGEYFSVSHGLPNHHVVSILLDDRDDVWAATNRGMARFSPRTREFRQFDTGDGLQGEIFLPRAAWKAPDGHMYFGGVNGITVFHPDQLQEENPYPPEVRITGLKIFNEAIRPGPGSVLKKPISETDYLRLSYQQRMISFDLLAFGYTQSHKNQYAYMIEGVDKDWNYNGTGTTASYSDLPRGRELIFKAKAANHDGVWNERPTELRLYIVPPFWERGWFQLSLFILLLGSIIGLYRYRVRAVKARNQWLEEQVDLQTAEIREQAKTIREKADQLDQLYRAQSKFFTGLTHEFRTPLTLLMGYLEVLAQNDRDEGQTREAIEQMHFNADQLLILVNQLMDVAKLESKRYPLRVESCDILDSLHNIIGAFDLMARRKNLRLIFEAGENLPARCWLDEDILQKLLNNLIGNAVKYTDEGYVKIRAQIPDGGRLSLVVEDTGIGIPADQLPFIFDQFYRSKDKEHSRREGTGLGLALVKQLIDLHKGEISVESKISQGSTFRVWLPVRESDYRDEEKAPATGTIEIRLETSAKVIAPFAQGEAPELNNHPANDDLPVILVVEDHPQIRAFLFSQLSDAYRVLTAVDGKDGWEKALSEMPDVILSDVLMPEMSGFELCGMIKNDRRTSHIPVILLTALSEREKRMEGLHTGADAYLNKPFHTPELYLRINNILAHQERLRRQFEKNLQPGYLPDHLNDPDQELLENLHHYFQDHLSTEKLMTDDITRALGISRTHLFRKMKTLTGMSLTEYLRDYRLRVAYQMLQQRSITVSEVIYATGFTSRSYFYRCFKKKFDMLPSEVTKDASSPPPTTI